MIVTMGKWILLFLALPPVDLYVLVRLGRAFGAAPVWLGVLLSALAGVAIARSVGLRELRDWRSAMAEGRTPSHGVLEGLLLLLGCIWLIVPGPVSDLLGLALLLRPVRRSLAERIVQGMRSAVEQGALHFTVQQPHFDQRRPWPPSHPASPAPPSGDVIDAEGVEVEPPTETQTRRKRLSS
ncbi:MAG: FxsA family protein [Polyangiales bacterium]